MPLRYRLGAVGLADPMTGGLFTVSVTELAKSVPTPLPSVLQPKTQTVISRSRGVGWSNGCRSGSGSRSERYQCCGVENTAIGR